MACLVPEGMNHNPLSLEVLRTNGQKLRWHPLCLPLLYKIGPFLSVSKHTLNEDHRKKVSYVLLSHFLGHIRYYS